jgi:hypothetical protein
MSLWDWSSWQWCTFRWLFVSVCIPLCRQRDQWAGLWSDDADWLSGDGHQDPPHQKLLSSSLPPRSAKESYQHVFWLPSSSPRGNPHCQHHPWVITVVHWSCIRKLRVGLCQTEEQATEKCFQPHWWQVENCLILQFKGKKKGEQEAALFFTVCPSMWKALESICKRTFLAYKCSPHPPVLPDVDISPPHLP